MAVRNRVRHPVLAVLLVSLVAIACGPAPTPTTTSSIPASSPTASDRTPVATPAPTPTEIAGPIAEWCHVDDLAVAHGPIEGAAGSRFTTMTLTVVTADGCVIPDTPTVDLRDAYGATITGAVPAGGAGSLEVPPGAAVASDVQLTGWCAEPPVDPVSLVYVLDTGTFEAEAILVAGGPFPASGDLPPCNGSGGVGLFPTAWRLR